MLAHAPAAFIRQLESLRRDDEGHGHFTYQLHIPRRLSCVLHLSFYFSFDVILFPPSPTFSMLRQPKLHVANKYEKLSNAIFRAVTIFCRRRMIISQSPIYLK